MAGDLLRVNDHELCRSSENAQRSEQNAVAKIQGLRKLTRVSTHYLNALISCVADSQKLAVKN